ncbi:MAG: ParB/RepB/Spo0J family partition protein [Dehalococcoidia bacterium]|nr:ParB/RepB/Spo0J family partition protein [Dehalococcoidia bacterium]
MAKGKTGLGRGLGALIPSLTPATDSVDINLIISNPFQPRQDMDAAELAQLAESIRQHGVLQPLLVSRIEKDDGATAYQVIAGERRLQAARLAGLTEVPVALKETTPREVLELALVENLQRADLNPLEEAQAYRRLMDEFGLSQSEVGSRVGKSRSAVANALRLLGLSEEIRSSLAKGEISEGHARALLGLPEEARLDAWRRVVEQALSVRQTEQMVRGWSKARRRRPRERRRDADMAALEERLREAFSTRVSLVRGRRGGRITIHFYSDEELDSIVARLLGS